MKTIIPFKLTCIPMKKLALINFEKDPDEVYKGLELQYLDGQPYGRGWRVIAYRNDSYVDVYDDNTLNTIENEDFNVAGKGLKHYIKTNMKDVRFEKDEYGVHICFYFQDVLNRSISVQIHEHTKGHSKAMNLLAPIGSSSENPTSLPLFFLYEFDFVRKHKTEMLIEIDGKTRKADNFPFPVTKELQWRYYTRYSMDCQIVEFAKAGKSNLTLVELNEDHSYSDGLTTYCFNADGEEISLKTITLYDKRHQVKMIFDQPLPIKNSVDGEVKGKFHINTDKVMGAVGGTYEWRQLDNSYSVSLTPDEGWTSVPNSFITKIILGPKSIFCTWLKSYRYMQEIDMKSFSSTSEWGKI